MKICWVLMLILWVISLHVHITAEILKHRQIVLKGCLYLNEKFCSSARTCRENKFDTLAKSMILEICWDLMLTLRAIFILFICTEHIYFNNTRELSDRRELPRDRTWSASSFKCDREVLSKSEKLLTVCRDFIWFVEMYGEIYFNNSRVTWEPSDWKGLSSVRTWSASNFITDIQAK